ncbi:tetratricopeptide repeat protein [bacterium]|nr:tetratricopeptide repeat protein [bacterium]
MKCDRKLFVFLVFAATLSAAAGPAVAGEIEQAQDYFRHGLNDKAKATLIETIHGKAAPAIVAEAYRLLGEIAYSEGRYSTALADWRKLATAYPNTKAAKEVKDKIKKLAEIARDLGKDELSNAIAKSYLKNGDFFSESDETVMIDTSWLPSEDLASSWYDRAAKEFPGTDAAELARIKKVKLFVGVINDELKEKRKNIYFYTKSMSDESFTNMTESFEELRKDFPNSSYLQSARYLIAQTYWKNKNWNETREWLNSIIEAGKGDDSFYVQLAKARLNKVEW